MIALDLRNHSCCNRDEAPDSTILLANWTIDDFASTIRYAFKLIATASAILMPSIAAERIPPA